MGIDQHGCGRSDSGTPESWNLSRWASDVKLFCDALGIKKPILAGVSMGGHVIGEYIRHYTNSLGGIILCNTEAKFDAKSIADQFIKHEHPEAAKAYTKFYEEPSKETFSDYAKYCLPLYAKNAYSDAEKKRCIGNIDVFLHFVKNQANNFDYRKDFSKINCPTLIMAGERGSHTPEAANEMAKCTPNQFLTYELFKDAGSPVYKDGPAQAYSVVKNFLVSKFI